MLARAWKWQRRLWPPPGCRYELFDLSAMVMLFMLFAFVIGTPSTATVDSMSWLFGDTPRQLWACLVSLSGLAGVAFSYWWSPRWGAAIVGASCFAWTCFLLIGLALSPNWVPAATAILFGFLVRHAALIAISPDCDE